MNIMLIVDILILVVFAFVLIKSADVTIVGLRRIGRRTHTASFVISALIVAIGTSFPELFVGITSALEKTPSLALGVVIGSNIANIALIGGITAAATGTIFIRGDFLRRDIWIALVAGLAPIILISDSQISRADGVILLAIYVAYATSFFRGRYLEVAREQKGDPFIYRFVRTIIDVGEGNFRDIFRIFIGVSLLLFSADIIVRVSKDLAQIANIPVFVIGLVVLAIGTSLPELAFSLRTVEDHEPGMFFGNILGSTIANSTLIIGVASIIEPIRIKAVSDYSIAAIAFVIVSLVFYFFARSKRRLDRWEGVVLLLIYLAFIVSEFL